MTSLPPIPRFPEHEDDTGDLSEEQLLAAIAYYKARLADIEHAPEGSPHARGRTRATSQLRQYQRQLTLLRGKHPLNGQQ